MGWTAQDLAPIASTGPSVNIPTCKDLVIKGFQIARTDTTATLKAVLPADATIVDIVVFGAASNAGTTATISIGTTSANANEIVSGADVKTAGGKIALGASWQTAYPNLVGLPLSGDLQIFAKYAETGTASSAGGPYTVVIKYVR